MKILVTGCAGFIGFHLTKRLLERGDEVVGLDSVNEYYDVRLKLGRLKELGIERKAEKEQSLIYENFTFFKQDLNHYKSLELLFKESDFDAVCNLAAQAGVRYSLEEPMAYIDSNIKGFMNILECCRHNKVFNLSYASSSSVYGLNESYPFSVSDNVDHPMSLYAATKKSNELMAHTYSHLYGLKTTGLRFFTVYGPWGRPDMALFKFTKAALAGEVIEVYNNGQMMRDFTYVDDIVDGLESVIDSPASSDTNWEGENPDPASSSAPYKIYNIGNSNPVNLLDFIKSIEEEIGTTIEKKFLPIQPGDVAKTFAQVDELVRDFNYKPSTSIEYGISKFISWYRSFYGL